MTDTMAPTEVAEKVGALRENIEKAFIGKSSVTAKALVALFAGYRSAFPDLAASSSQRTAFVWLLATPRPARNRPASLS